MEVVVHRAAPERNEVGRVERQVVPAVVLHGFPQPHREPRPERDHVLREKERPEERADPEDHGLDRVRVLRGNAERVRVLVVNLVHVPVHGLVVQAAVDPVKVEILDDEKHRELPREIAHRGEDRPHGEP
eukprot:31032-Pelagococcus_subviridis.AAC.12